MADLPVKLLDCPEVPVEWPEDGVSELGEALRIYYTSNLHHDGLWVPFYHDFETGPLVYEPKLIEEQDQADVFPPVNPIFMGFFDRLYVKVDDAVIAIMHEENPDHGPEADYVVHPPIEACMLLWDVEHRQLVVGDDINVWFVVGGPGVFLDDEAMIGG